MIQRIEENLEDNKLTVKVYCKVRKFASNPIKVLTTEDVIDIIKKKYENLKLLKSPSNLVGNTRRRKMQSSGIWVFEVETLKKQKQATQKKTTRGREKKVETKQSSTTAKTSIRSRMSKLATKKD